MVILLRLVEAFKVWPAVLPSTSFPTMILGEVSIEDKTKIPPPVQSLDLSNDLPSLYLTPTIRVTPITAQYPLFDHTSDALKSHTPYLESLHTLISPQSFPGHASLPTHSKSLSQKCTQHPPPFCFPSVLPNSFACGPSLEPRSLSASFVCLDCSVWLRKS